MPGSDSGSPAAAQAANFASPKGSDHGVEPARMLTDAAVGVGLVLVLAIVFMLDGTSSGVDETTNSTPTEEFEIVIERPEDESGGRLLYRTLRLGVTPSEYDDVGKLLDSLGSGYRYRPIPFDALLDADQLLDSDVIFLTCELVSQPWMAARLRDAQRGSGDFYRVKGEVDRAVSRALRRFVAEGGTLYASDLQFDRLALVFPEFIDHAKAGRGAVQTVRAEVIDPGLAKRLGDSVELRFDMQAWRPAAFAGPEVTVYLQGNYEMLDGSRATGPLLVRFPFGQGTVIFTSFHNEAQNSQMELELLRYLVFTTVTAREESNVKRTMIRGGFSPTERNLLSASRESRPVTEIYQCADRGPLQFVLGFEDRGARLQLTVTGPDGTRQEKTNSKTFTIEISNAAAGPWRYTVTPVDVPYENFPFTLVIGEKR